MIRYDDDLPSTYLAPAYGRKYATSQAMLEAWESGKDFYLLDRLQYCSVRDLELLRKEYKELRLMGSADHQTVRVF